MRKRLHSGAAVSDVSGAIEVTIFCDEVTVEQRLGR
jgi:hypothetical protein